MIADETRREYIQKQDNPDRVLWYYWRNEHWGTKWQPDGAERRQDGPSYRTGQQEVLVTFATAWSPPLPVVLAMSKKFPTLDFELRYFESGCCFNGIYECEGGEVTQADQGPYYGDRGG
jgi:hypothetical protein